MYICSICKTPTAREGRCETCGWVKTITVKADELSSTTKPLKRKKSLAPEISIIVLSYNRLNDTKKCLKHIVDNTTKSYEIIVVDNGSDKETTDWLKKQDVIDKLILNKTNLGVAGGRNKGMKVAKGEYIINLDNDIFVGEKWEHLLIGTLEFRYGVGIVGINGNNVFNYNPLIFVKPQYSERVAECDVVPGGLTVFRRDLLQRIGYFDEDMPNPNFWHEDLGFCKKAKMAGLKVYTISNFPHIHRGGQSHNAPSKVPFGYFENAAYIEHKYRDDNTLIIHRNICPDENCSESFCVLARNIANEMRKMGFVVIRKSSVRTEPVTFDFCKAFDMKFNGKRFALMHLENDRPPRAWLKTFEPYDYAFNVSPHAYHQLIEWGFPKKKMINVSPNGVNDDIYNTKVKPLNFYPNKFKFLTVGASQPRKGTDILVKAYFEEFTAKDNVLLVIKDYKYGWSDWTKELIENAKKSHKNPPLVEHIFEDYPIKKLAGLYRAVALNGAYFHPHKGECFGLPIIEALACGCRVGTTNYTGPKYTLKEFAKKYSKHIHLFDYRMDKSTFHNWEKEPYYEKDEKPMWAIADISDCRKWLRSVYNGRYDKRTAKIVSDKIIEKFKWQNTVKRFAEKLKEYGET